MFLKFLFGNTVGAIAVCGAIAGGLRILRRKSKTRTLSFTTQTIECNLSMQKVNIQLMDFPKEGDFRLTYTVNGEAKNDVPATHGIMTIYFPADAFLREKTILTVVLISASINKQTIPIAEAPENSLSIIVENDCTIFEFITTSYEAETSRFPINIPLKRDLYKTNI